MNDGTILSVEETFRTEYFLYIVDQAISTLRNRFEQFQLYESVFGFLCDVKQLNSLVDIDLKAKCLNLEKFLTHDNVSDIDGSELHLELRVLREMLKRDSKSQTKTPIEIMNFVQSCDIFQIL